MGSKTRLQEASGAAWHQSVETTQPQISNTTDSSKTGLEIEK